MRYFKISLCVFCQIVVDFPLLSDSEKADSTTRCVVYPSRISKEISTNGDICNRTFTNLDEDNDIDASSGTDVSLVVLRTHTEESSTGTHKSSVFLATLLIFIFISNMLLSLSLLFLFYDNISYFNILLLFYGNIYYLENCCCFLLRDDKHPVVFWQQFNLVVVLCCLLSLCLFAKHSSGGCKVSLLSSLGQFILPGYLRPKWPVSSSSSVSDLFSANKNRLNCVWAPFSLTVSIVLFTVNIHWIAF